MDTFEREFREMLYRQTYGRFRAHRTPDDHTPPDPLITDKPCLKRIPLPTELPDLGSLDSRGPAHGDFGSVSLANRLSALLHCTLGVSRLEIGTPRPLHRPVPSPRCLHACELLAALPPGSPTGEGSFRYHPVRHELEVRREERVWHELEQALGMPLHDADAVLAVSAEWWRIAWMYGDFSFHLATLEAGHLRGHLLWLAEPLGFRAQWMDRFDSRALSACFGLNPEAETLLSVLVLRSVCEQRPEAAERLPFRTGIPGTDTDGDGQANLLKQCPDLMRLTERTRPHPPSVGRRLDPPIASFPLAPADRPFCEPDLSFGKWRYPRREDILKRRSGGNDVLGLAADGSPVSLEELSAVLGRLRDHVAVHPELVRGIRLFLWARRVEGLSPGIREVRPDGSLVSLRTDGCPSLAGIGTADPRTAHLDSFPIAFLFTADYIGEYRLTGPEAMPLLQQRTGHLTQWLMLHATAMGWMARPVKSFDELRAEEILNLTETGETAVYLLLVGKHRHPFLSLDMSLGGV
ncbi:SagB/ThcOx family dehydrogenase [Staphylospora marina]|uniref:SagB/ThcOx family dehydrogenase n=1 Tax=Staphylospora marina TaxID=2490858 RepID=UPI000F5C031F|nr:SagB/ThcOx family dehydrogenase [Staphylospora marina]